MSSLGLYLVGRGAVFVCGESSGVSALGPAVKHPLLGRSLPAPLLHMPLKREIGMKLEAMGSERHTRANACKARRFENSREKPCRCQLFAEPGDEQK